MNRRDTVSGQEVFRDLCRPALVLFRRRGETKRNQTLPHYRRNWKSDQTAKRAGRRFIVRFYNPLDYAGHLEHGFRSHFVPGHWEGHTFVYNRDDPEGGMFVGPKGGYVRGRYTMKRAVKRTLDTQQARVSRKITREINNRMK